MSAGPRAEKIKGAFSALRQFLATESLLKMKKIVFYFLFHLKTYSCAQDIYFGHVEK